MLRLDNGSRDIAFYLRSHINVTFRMLFTPIKLFGCAPLERNKGRI